MDVGVGDGHYAGVGGDGDLVVRRAQQLAGERAAAVVVAAGAHTRAVLHELGYSDDEIDDLHASGAVGTQEQT